MRAAELGATALLALTLELAACGSGGDEATTRPEPPTTATIKHVSTPPSPATFVRATLAAKQPSVACLAYTREALTRAYGSVDGCEAAVRSGGSADSVRIRSAWRTGSTAHVVAVPDGGPSSGEVLRISLILERGAWRIGAIYSNVPVGP